MSGSGTVAGAPGRRAPQRPTREQPVQKLLAAAGLASRRGAEALIRSGRVTLDGVPVELGARADPTRHRLALDGRPVEPPAPAYWLLYKPRGVLCTVRDPGGRSTVLDLLPASAPRGLFPVGRLDRDSEGLLLLTNDGDTAHVLLHPSFQSPRDYEVTVRGRLGGDAARRLERGMQVGGYRTAPARLSQLRSAGATSSPRTRFTLTLCEGKKRQIRLSLAALGYSVLRLRRLRMGPLELGALRPGAARPLRAAERRRLIRYAASARRRRARAVRRSEAKPNEVIQLDVNA